MPGILFFCAHHDERLLRILAVVVDDALHHQTTADVQSVKRFVKNKQIGILDEGARQKTQTLLAAGEFEERAVGNCFDAETLHPLLTLSALLGTGTMIETDGIREAGSHNVDGGNVLLISAMEFGRDVADVLLDLPDALSGASLASEEFDVAGVALRAQTRESSVLLPAPFSPRSAQRSPLCTTQFRFVRIVRCP